MSGLLITAGALVLLGVAVHGALGERLVVRELSPDRLPPTRLGGARMTMAMIHVTWHMTTFAFFTTGVGLVVAGAALHGDARRAIAVLAASAVTGFAALAVGLGGFYNRSPRKLFQHPAPIVLSTAALLAWLGAFG